MEEKVFIKNAKGLKLAAVLHSPKEKGRFPGIILLHGFTGYKEEKHIETLARDLAENGFVAIRFDCSGFGESEGSIENDFRFSNYLSDIDYVYKYLISRENVDKERIGIWGQSMGGMLSIIYAANNPSLIKTVVSISAPAALDTSGWLGQFTEEWKRTGFFTKASSRTGKMLKISYAFLEDSRQFNVLNFIAKTNKPILIILGKEDVDVLPIDTRNIFEKANEPKELMEVENMPHDYKNNSELIKVVDEKVISFFKNNL